MSVKRVAIALLAAHILSLTGFSTYAVALTELQNQWSLSNSEAGWIASGFFIGYVLAVSTWNSLTDVMDARRIYAAGSLLAGMGSMGFAMGAQGFVSATFFQICLGAGIAGTYMPGLKILSDRTKGAEQSRYVAFYTAFFGFGAASSLFVTGQSLPLVGINTTFFLCGLGPLLGMLVVLTYTRALAHEREKKPISISFERLFPIQSWKQILADKNCLGYTVGYGVHCMELFGSRAWIVAFLAFSYSLMPKESLTVMSAATLAAVVSIFTVTSSILGNEVALKVGRRAWIVMVMAITTFSGVVMALFAGSAWWVMFVLVSVYSMLIMADSATLTAGLVGSADPKMKGAALGLYSLIGFGGGGVAGPAVFGFALDLAGGGDSAAQWAVAFLVLGAGCLAFPVIDAFLHRSSPFGEKNAERN